MSQPLFFEDRDGFDSEADAEEEDHIVVVPSKKRADPSSERTETKPVWFDEDDEDATIDLAKVKRRRKLRKSVGEEIVSGSEYSKRIRDFYATKTSAGASRATAWAQLPCERKGEKGDDDQNDSDEEDNGEDEPDASDKVKSLLRSTAKLLSSGKTSAEIKNHQERPPLQSSVLVVKQMRNANEEDPSKSEARCVEFHPSGRLLLTAGLDKTLRIFQVDGEQNAKVQGVHIKGFPIHTAKFTGGGSQIVLGGRRKFFHEVDLNSGRVATVQTLLTHDERSWERFEVSADGSKLAFLGQQGKIVLLANRAKREIGQLRLNNCVANVSFAPENGNEHHVYASSVDGTVYLWDTRRMACIDRHKDEGAVHSTCLAASKSHYALGSDSGVVNVYSSSSMRTSGGSAFGMRTETPMKRFLNLTTSVGNVTFNCDGKLMAFSSHEKKNAIRIAHIPSMTVYSNWPSVRANVRRACCLRFSPNGGYLAIGNDKGDVQLMRLLSYAAS